MSRFRMSLFCLLAALGFANCSVIDGFSPRAVDYNREAEQAQLQALLLNIVRASMGRPMQFTTLSNINGTQSINGGSTLSIPFGHHRPATGVSPDILGFSGTVSGGPTFTVPVLDTQEFYQGELKPLTAQEYHFFIEEGYTPAQLLYLFASSIELTTTDTANPRHFTFLNYVSNDFDFDQFAAVADYLLSLGMTLEQMRRTERIGPELTVAQVRNLREIAELSKAGLRLGRVKAHSEPKATETAQSTNTETTTKPKGKPHQTAKGQGPERYEIVKSSLTYRPCFDPTALQVSKQTDLVAKELICGSNDPSDPDSTQSEGNLTRSGGFQVTKLAELVRTIRAKEATRLRSMAAEPDNVASGRSARLLDAAKAIEQLPPLDPDARYQLKIYTRSTEAILFYLGSVVARRIHPAPSRGPADFGAEPRTIQVKVGETYIPYPLLGCPPTAEGNTALQPDVHHVGNHNCENFFVVENKDQTADVALAVSYEGKTYWIPANGKAQGRTMRLLDLVKQLLALHTSAKELPSSNVLNIIGPAQ